MLEVTNLGVHFDVFEGESKVLTGVSLRVDEGDTVSLVGETGCGKSVTIREILRILPSPPAKTVSGQVIFKGQDLLAMTEEELHHLRGTEMALIPQEPMQALNPVFSIGEQFTDLIRWQGNRRASFGRWLAQSFDREGKRQARERALDLLARVNIPDPARILDSYPLELSGGMQQRVLIAMALAGHPSLLIADEPGTALDVTTQQQILQLLKDQVEEEGMAVLYITHNLGVAREMTERVYVMYAGAIAEHASTRELFREPKHPYTQGLLASVPKLTGGEVQGIEGRIPDYVAPPPGCRFAPRCPHEMPRCTDASPALFPVADGHEVACYLYEQ